MSFNFNFLDSLNLSDNEASQKLSKLSLRNTVLEDTCIDPAPCANPASKYRSLDGSCNNLIHPSWGQQNTIFQRLVPAQYGNGNSASLNFKFSYINLIYSIKNKGIDSSRPASDGGELLNPRNISLGIIGDDGPETTDVTLIVMSFGQFITHDITFSEDFTFGTALRYHLDSYF